MIENYRHIRGYENYYLISDLGRVYSLITKRVLKPRLQTNYYSVRLKGKEHSIHRLVAEAFIPNKECLPSVDHINMDKLDNRLSNLRWITHQKNVLNSFLVTKRGRDPYKLST